MSAHVIHESRLKLARLLIADFDPAVTAIAAQPFWLRAHAGGRARRHVPDFFLLRGDQSVIMVNVKPAARLADPQVAEVLELVRSHGWDYEIWTGTDPAAPQPSTARPHPAPARKGPARAGPAWQADAP